MTMDVSDSLICPKHTSPARLNEAGDAYLCPAGCSYPVIGNIPRFVANENYAAGFGMQWNEYRTAQLDSFTGLSISRDRLNRLLGGSFDIVRGKKVLEAGCGAGRFTEILLECGAAVFAADISTAVEANYANCHKHQNYFVCQADILRLPVRVEQFDIVVCVGVVQHTPDSEDTIAALCSYVRPGGLLVMDHYTYGYPVTLSRRLLRAYLLGKLPAFSMKFCRILTNILWPLHRAAWSFRNIPFLGFLRALFLRLSPVVDYQDAYPQLNAGLLKIWAALDTHDTLTDAYKHMRSSEEIIRELDKQGMISITVFYAGNGVEAQAVKPLKP